MTADGQGRDWAPAFVFGVDVVQESDFAESGSGAAGLVITRGEGEPVEVALRARDGGWGGFDPIEDHHVDLPRFSSPAIDAGRGGRWGDVWLSAGHNIRLIERVRGEWSQGQVVRHVAGNSGNYRLRYLTSGDPVVVWSEQKTMGRSGDIVVAWGPLGSTALFDAPGHMIVGLELAVDGQHALVAWIAQPAGNEVSEVQAIHGAWPTPPTHITHSPQPNE